MKRILLTAITAMLLFVMPAKAQVKAFEKYSNVKNITYITVPQAMLKIAGGFVPSAVEGVNISNIYNKLNAIQIISSQDKTTRQNLLADAHSYIKNNKYDLLLVSKDEGDTANIYCKLSKDKNTDSAIIMVIEEKDATTVLVFSGTFNEKDLQKLMSQ